MNNQSSKASIDKIVEEKVRGLVLQMSGQRLPSERDLAEQLQISRPRLRTILASLRAEGLIEQKIGSGTYALSPDKTQLHRVAVLIDERLKLGSDPFVSYLFECLQDNLQSEGARCMIERVGAGGGPYRLEDGAITLGLAGQKIVDDLRPSDPPVVGLLMSPDMRPRRRASIFMLEDKQAGADAAEFLARRGCRRIVYVGRHDIPSSQDRWSGCQEFCAGAEIALSFVDSHLSYAAGLKLGLEWSLPETGEQTGVIVTNDWLAVGFRAGLRQHSSRDSESLMIVSFDGLPIVADKALDIHSLAIPIQAMARDAVAELRNLGSSPISVGRLVRYPLAWFSDNTSAPATGDGAEIGAA
ncbi:substrate-binding domain-containing protein [Capsulimonas corticalis]|nr:substrate-binding domain-containing protein [Capsulimonas corticalis]